ncbi:XRE family transcriptional regulator [Reichenbachiella agarivorans]|uniref:XRE family transcriptional regulator n=1 Tax=Reichenbachiella agarivorans TaxID=2979464 RepID=A0ABY6CNB4_9BACT|nr:XRE family transcriptional regulator [Reichenbachiella agarivorans]UXP32012.1 XRE family transcriptional regulator [Reichenbachiella agarivorans]
MALEKQYIKLIFGIKLKQYRQRLNLSLQSLSDSCGISVSYLNEIEKGKKYPKTEKIIALAQALKVHPMDLKSEMLDKTLAPITQLMHSGILSELPLELFGLEVSRLLDLLSNAPSKLNAFIGTLLEVSRNYDVRVETFYFSVLRSYQEIHENYFDEIEKKAEEFLQEISLIRHKHISAHQFEKYLEDHYDYKIIADDFSSHDALQDMRSLTVVKRRKRQLILNSRLSSRQRAFYLAKEVGYNYLGYKERNHAMPWVKIDSFDQVLNDFRASYFASAVLINRKDFTKDLKVFFQSEKWNQNILINTMREYNATPEMVLQRMTNLLPASFGLKELFFFKFNHKPGSDHYELSKELHLSRQHQPRGTVLQEHFCRRWGFIEMLDTLAEVHEEKPEQIIGGAQIARYFDTKDEFLLLSLAKPFSPTQGINNSLSLGIRINEKTKETIQFLNDPSIKTRLVNDTCERCPAANCNKRVAPATLFERSKKESERIELLRVYGLN